MALQQQLGLLSKRWFGFGGAHFGYPAVAGESLKTFHCDGCGSLVFFENVKCLKCGHELGFLPPDGELRALETAMDGLSRPLSSKPAEPLYRHCGNGQQHQVCNWMVPDTDPDALCISCRLNEMIPNLSVSENVARWHKVEMAKRRVIYTILRLGLPLHGMPAENRPALRFKLIGSLDTNQPLTMGHCNGLITINIDEAEDVERERRRVNLHEPYRTLLGHVRHEIAHYYWDRLISNSKWLGRVRELFGDETPDYAAALKRYYAQGPPPDWQARYISAYASAHPWEDWAETWAHYFHIMDMVETAGSFGMILKPHHPAADSMTTDPRNDFDANTSIDSILGHWFPLTYALNSLNRGMGLSDAYPFALSNKVIDKLRLIHEVIQSMRAKAD